MIRCPIGKAQTRPGLIARQHPKESPLAFGMHKISSTEKNGSSIQNTESHLFDSFPSGTRLDPLFSKVSVFDTWPNAWQAFARHV